MKASKATIVLGIVYSALCVFVLAAELYNVIPLFKMMTGLMLLTLFVVPLLWIVTMILMTVWAAKGKDNRQLFIVVLLIAHTIDFAVKVPNIILAPKDYALTFFIFVTALAGMICGLCIRNRKKIYVIILGVSFVVLAGMYAMRIKITISQMFSQFFSPVNIVIVNIIKPVVLLAAICLFAYHIFVRDGR